MASKRTVQLVTRLFHTPPRINTTTRSFFLIRSRITHSSPCMPKISHEHSETAPLNRYEGVLWDHLGHYTTVSSAHLRLMPTGDHTNVLEKLRGMGIVRDRIRLDGLMPPSLLPPEKDATTVEDAKKILRAFQLEKVKKRLRLIEEDCVEYKEFLEICAAECSSFDQVVDFAKVLDESGNVIILGNNVYLNQEKIFKDSHGLIPARIQPDPFDPRMKEFQEMEKMKAEIDRKAETYVRRELSCGFVLFAVQTVGFMRLTFWELTWDVMEPVCFFVASFYFLCSYGFFLRTLKEPSFEGFYQSRFGAKQKRIMKSWKFDLERYNELKKACVSPVHR